MERTKGNCLVEMPGDFCFCNPHFFRANLETVLYKVDIPDEPPVLCKENRICL